MSSAPPLSPTTDPVVDVERPLPSFVPAGSWADDATIEMVPVLEQTREMPAVTVPILTRPTPVIVPARHHLPWGRVLALLGVGMTVGALVGVGIFWFAARSGQPLGRPAEAAVPPPAPAVVVPQPRAEGPALVMEPVQVVVGGPVTPVTPLNATTTCPTLWNADLLFGPTMAIDGNDLTSFVCGGDGVGTTVTLELPAGTKVAELGIVGSYLDSRHLTQVTWTLPDGHQIVQHLDPDEPGMQRIRPRVTTGGTVSVRFDASREGSVDAIATPEILVATPA